MVDIKDDIKNSTDLKIIEKDNNNPIINDLSNNKNISLLENTENTKEDLEYSAKKDKNQSNKLYGNNIDIINPRKIGNMWAFLYYKDKPLIVIGPECK